MPKTTRLLRRSGHYTLRVRVPDDVRPIIGKREIWRTLETTDHRTAVARGRRASVAIDQLFAEARAALAGGSRTVPSEELQHWALSWLDERERNALGEVAEFERLGDDARAHHACDLTIDEAVLLGRAESYDRVDFRDMARAVALARGTVLTPGSREEMILASLLRRAMLERTRRLRERVLGNPEERVFDKLFVPTTATRAAGARSLTLRELITRYERDPARAGLSRKTRDGYRVIFRVLEELLGAGTAIDTIDRDACCRVRDILASAPPNAGKRFPGLTLEQAARKARALNLPTLHANAVNSYLHNLSALFNYAVREQKLQRNPAVGLRVVATAEERTGGRRGFDIAQLNAIFAAPLYTQGPRNGRFWVPLLALFLGLRSNECCQLRVKDVTKLGDVDVVLIRAEGKDQRVKTKAGTRYVPLHPLLRDLGFCEFVMRMRSVGEERLFPELPLGANGYYSDPFGKWFNRTFLGSIGLKSPSLSFHSFRHGYSDALRAADVSIEHIRLLGGWSGPGGAERAYGGTGEALAKALYRSLAKVRYPGLSLDHLQTAASEV